MILHGLLSILIVLLSWWWWRRKLDDTTPKEEAQKRTTPTAQQATTPTAEQATTPTAQQDLAASLPTQVSDPISWWVPTSSSESASPSPITAQSCSPVTAQMPTAPRAPPNTNTKIVPPGVAPLKTSPAPAAPPLPSSPQKAKTKRKYLRAQSVDLKRLVQEVGCDGLDESSSWNLEMLLERIRVRKAVPWVGAGVRCRAWCSLCSPRD